MGDPTQIKVDNFNYVYLLNIESE